MQAVSSIADYWNFPWVMLALIMAHLVIERRGNAMLAERSFRALMIFVIAFAISVPTVAALKIAFDFPRPLMVLGQHAVRVLGQPQYRHSLPSGHATFAALLTASLWGLGWMRLRLVLLAFAILTGISRMWVGAHFPKDVIAGYLCALFSVAVASFLLRSFNRG